MPVSIQFLGAAASKIVTARGKLVLIDPLLDKNPNKTAPLARGAGDVRRPVQGDPSLLKIVLHP
jgi:hypothetical protein